MNFDKHYGEQTEDILIDGLTPYANSVPINKCFIGKKFAKIIKSSTYNIDTYMNVCFEREQDIEVGSVLVWVLDHLHLDVLVIGETRLNVKGKYVWAYAVGIIE